MPTYNDELQKSISWKWFNYELLCHQPLMSWQEADSLDYWKERLFLNKEIQKDGITMISDCIHLLN